MSMPLAMPISALLVLKHFRTVVLVSKGARICRFLCTESLCLPATEELSKPSCIWFQLQMDTEFSSLVRCLTMFFGIICAVEEFRTIRLLGKWTRISYLFVNTVDMLA
jgi:hypothetical protein